MGRKELVRIYVLYYQIAVTGAVPLRIMWRKRAPKGLSDFESNVDASRYRRDGGGRHDDASDCDTC